MIVLLMPMQWIPIAEMTTIEHRMLAIFIMAILFWVLEPIPIFATSVLVVAIELMLISDKGPIWFRLHPDADHFGILVSYQSILHTFASPIVMLFLGGFFLAMAATKYKLDVNLARVILKPFGTNTKTVMFGLMIITAVFSMFMSNTATTALMLAILAPILKSFKPGDPGKIAYTLCIPFAANVGGIGTPIGTPPNAVAMKYLMGDNSIGFGEWMLFGVPFALLMLVFVWLLLLFFSPPQEATIELEIKGKFLKNWQAIVVYLTFGVTILLWLTGGIHGMSSYVVAMIPVSVFVCTKIITKDDLKLISWEVLWLISGGIALGLGLEQTGLSKNLIASIPFELFPPVAILVLATVLALVMSTFISNTATANLLLPIMAALGTNLSALEHIGGDKILIITVAFACSFAMALPVSTPPNAMAYATGMIESKDLLKTGVITSIIGLLLVYLMAWLFNVTGYI
jgi:sodium-dependent dicarboxylate transporter 2/3/5